MLVDGLISLGDDHYNIADSIYAYSKLNGDTFATEFLRRRKAVVKAETTAYGSDGEADGYEDSEDEEESLEERIEWLWKSVKDFYSYLRFHAK